MRCLLYLLALAACERATTHKKPPAPPSPPPKDPLEIVADRIATEKVEGGETTGVTVGVARRGKISFVKGYGDADREAGRHATADTVYRIGGLAEQFTAVAVLLLVEQHKLALDDDITRYVAFDTHGRTVTIEELLRHASGMPRLSEKEREQLAQAKLAPGEILQRMTAGEWDQDWVGSDGEYLALGLAIEKVSGEPYVRFLEREVIARAGLKHTAPCDAVGEPIAARYRMTWNVTAPDLDSAPALQLSPGSLCSTVPDLLAWWAALSSGQVVSASTYKMMITKDGSVRGMGVIVNEAYERPHLQGDGTYMMLSEYPADDIAIVVASNTLGRADARIERALSMAAFGMTSKEMPLPPDVRDSLVGEYQFEDGGRTEVARWRNNLAIRVSAGPLFELEYQGNDTFVSFDSYFKIVFHREGGAVTGFTSYQPPDLGGNIDAVRVQSR